MSSNRRSLQLSIDGAALERRLNQLARISQAPAPIVTRVLYSEADMRCRDFVRRAARDVGLVVREDAVGNLFARWSGSEPALSAIGTGSHTDAIPNAGMYDGVVGVLGGLEAIASLKRAGFKPRRSLEVVMFTAEEPTRFGLGCIGSRLMVGAIDVQAANALVDPDGQSFDQLRKAAGFRGPLESVRLPQGHFHAFVELHIEQGPVLEAENIPIGIVEHIAGPSNFRLTLVGEGGHAGGQLMAGRSDALLAAAEIALAVEKAAMTSGSPDTVGTTGVLKIQPDAINSIPYHAYMEIDLRDTRRDTRAKALLEIKKTASKVCSRRGVKLEFDEINSDLPVAADQATIAVIENVCTGLGLASRKLVSRACHDSFFVARIAPTTMIFIPCRYGWSHRPEEYASPRHIECGTAVLAHTLARLSA